VDEQDSGQSLLDRLGFIGTAGIKDLARLAENRRLGHSGRARYGKVLEAAGFGDGDLAGQENELVRVQGFDREILEGPGLGFQFILQPGGVGAIGGIGLITDTKRGGDDFEDRPVLLSGRKIAGNRCIDLVMQVEAELGRRTRDDDAMVLQENDLGQDALFCRSLAGSLDRKGQLGAWVDIGYKCEVCTGRGHDLSGDLRAFGGAGQEVAIDRMGVQDKGVEQGMEARLNGWAQDRQAVKGARRCLGGCGAGFFNIVELGWLLALVKSAQGRIINHGIGIAGLDLAELEARCLDCHQSVVELGRGIATAALDIVGAAASSLGHAGEFLERASVTGDKFRR